MGVIPNSLRYGAPTGRILIRWEGARQPVVWTGPAPAMEASTRDSSSRAATCTSSVRRQLRHLRDWAGIRPAEARAAFEVLRDELTPVRTPIGDAWILADDEAAFRAKPGAAAAARLLPSGDTYFLLWEADRKLLVPDAKARAALWTSRVWPGALLVNGEIIGVGAARLAKSLLSSASHLRRGTQSHRGRSDDVASAESDRSDHSALELTPSRNFRKPISLAARSGSTRCMSRKCSSRFPASKRFSWCASLSSACVVGNELRRATAASDTHIWTCVSIGSCGSRWDGHEAHRDWPTVEMWSAHRVPRAAH